jgi:hypothetical protein
MGEAEHIALLKKILRHELAAFCRRGHATWKESISATVEEIREHSWEAVFFGGTLRSLLLSRLDVNTPGRPRDIDIVMKGATLDELKTSFGPYVKRQTRFGGLKLQRVNWQLDLWPLEETHALKEDGAISPSFSDLPFTTFFNVEAIAVEVWSRPGQARQIFSGDDQFFRGVLNRTIEINREQNPFPELCVVRALVMTAKLKWQVGQHLLHYLADHGSTMSASDFEEVQQKHYGTVQCRGEIFQRAIYEVQRVLRQRTASAAELPLPGQLSLWLESNQDFQHRIRLHALTASERRRALRSSDLP